MKSAYEQLADLRKRASDEKGRARDAALRLEAGKAKRQDAHDRLVAAHRDGNDKREIERAKTAIRKADEDLEFLQAEAQGLAERAAVAAQAVQNFEISDNERLLAELAPKAAEARDAVNAWIEQGRQVFADYDAVVAEASRLVSATGKSPRQEGPHPHGLEQHIHALHQAVANRPVPLPMPDFAHTRFLAEQERQLLQRSAA